jgi:hypothetical protein
MNKVMEYMAMGKPIVSFELKEARVSAGEAAVYAPANDESQFAKLIAHLLDDPEARARMGEIGKERVSGPLSWEHSVKSLLAAYAAAVGTASVPRQRDAGAGIARPDVAASVPQPRQSPVEDQHREVAAGVDDAHPAVADEPAEGP